MTKTNNPHIGSSLDDFLEDDALLSKTHAVAVKRTETWEACLTSATLGQIELVA